MIRTLFLCWFAVLAYTVAMMYQPDQQGYTQSEIDAVTAKLYPHKKSHHKAMTGAAQAVALADVYGLTVKDVAQPIKIWGQP